MDDRKIVDLYWARQESAIFETEQKYGRYCHYIAYHILYNNEDANEVVNDTYWKTWNTIPPHRPDPLKPYVGMLSRQLAVNVYEGQHAQKRGGQMPLILEELSECVPDNRKTDLNENLALRDALNRFLHTLPKKTQNIFVRRYWYTDSIAEIAKAYAMKENNVAILLFRTRKKLQEFLQTEDFEV